MNKKYFQFKSDEDNNDSLDIMYLNLVDEDDEEPYERVDQQNPPGEASRYELSDFLDSWERDLTSFRLEFIYEV